MTISRLETKGGVPTTSFTVLYTAPTGKDVIVSDLRVANIIGVQVSYSLKVNSRSFNNNTPIEVGGSHILVEDGVVYLRPGQTVEALCTTVSGIDVAISVLEKDALP
jgi:hypothetical protein